MIQEPEGRCDLCIMEHRTPWYYQDDTFLIVECDYCHVPMVVYRRHGTPNPEEKVLMARAAATMFPGKKLDFTMRKIEDHYHFHVRDR